MIIQIVLGTEDSCVPLVHYILRNQGIHFAFRLKLWHPVHDKAVDAFDVVHSRIGADGYDELSSEPRAPLDVVPVKVNYVVRAGSVKGFIQKVFSPDLGKIFAFINQPMYSLQYTATHSPKDISSVEYFPPSCVGIVPETPLRFLVVAAHESGLGHVDDAGVRLIREEFVQTVEGGLDGVDHKRERVLRLHDDAKAECAVHLSDVAANDVPELNHVLHGVIELRAHQIEKELHDGARRGRV